MAAADSDKRFALIKENLAEVLNEEIIKKILDEGQHPKIYWGTFRWESLSMRSYCTEKVWC
jgi:tyrosyl-tRNA synthetase